jgi:L-asparaginase
MQNKKVLLIYTGGTIGMITDPITGVLRPFDFSQITSQVPEIRLFSCEIDSVSFTTPIDSSNMTPDIWKDLVRIIEQHYNDYDGFVVLHGTDTMAYTASAVSFMVQNLSKPIVFTGSQLPIGIIRTDGKENLITAIEIASSYKDGIAVVPEVSLYFEYKLYRGNRITKLSAHHFNAFESFNYPYLAEAGIDIDFNYDAIMPSSKEDVSFNYGIENDINVLKLYPGISKKMVAHFFNAPGLKAVILETFGAGNATSYDWFLDEIELAIQKGIVIVNVTQCKSGRVNQTKYETGKGLAALGVISGDDITIEAAVTKLMFLLGNYSDVDLIRSLFTKNIAGEKTEYEN